MKDRKKSIESFNLNIEWLVVWGMYAIDVSLGVGLVSRLIEDPK